MEHEGRCVGNRVNAYTSDMDFHGGSKLSKLTYPIKTIYSKEARVQLRKVLDDFKPDVCHLNNFNYQLTPSIILEIVKWRKETGRDCKIIFTAHDYQLVCPNHMLNDPNTHQNCEKFYMLFPFFCFLIGNKKRAWGVAVVALMFNWLCSSYFSAGRGNIVYDAIYFIAGGLVFLYRKELVEFASKYKVIAGAILLIATVSYFAVGGYTLMMLFFCVAALIYSV